jgi:hypothetical protein
MHQPDPPARSSLTDSGWYWLYLYCTFGLITLVVAGPKIARLQLQSEQNYQARQRAGQQAAGVVITEPLATLENRRINLQPLFLILASLLSVGWISLWYRHFGSRRKSSPLPIETPDP